MSDLEYLLTFTKQCHEAKDVAELLDIIRDVEQLDFLYRQGNQNTVFQFVQNVIAKHKTEADEHDRGRQPAQDIHQLVASCRHFLVELGKDKIAKKAREKSAEESFKHLGGN